MTDTDITPSKPSTISRATGTTTGGSMNPSPLSSIGAAPILGLGKPDLSKTDLSKKDLGKKDLGKMTMPDGPNGKADRNPPKFEEKMQDMRAGMSPTEMRQGITGQGVRAVLVVSMAGAALALAVVYMYFVP